VIGLWLRIGRQYRKASTPVRIVPRLWPPSQPLLPADVRRLTSARDQTRRMSMIAAGVIAIRRHAPRGQLPDCIRDKAKPAPRVLALLPCSGCTCTPAGTDQPECSRSRADRAAAAYGSRGRAHGCAGLEGAPGGIAKPARYGKPMLRSLALGVSRRTILRPRGSRSLQSSLHGQILARPCRLTMSPAGALRKPCPCV
jgi:hypothetical protein